MVMRQAFAWEVRMLPVPLRRSLTDDQGAKCGSTDSSRSRRRSGSTLPAHTVPRSGHEREHQPAAAVVLPQGHAIDSALTRGDQAGAGDFQRSATESPELAQSRTCDSPPVAQDLE